MTIQHLNLILLTASLVATLKATGSAQIVTWDPKDGGNGHSYEVVNTQLTWFDAKAAAEARGGYLATITSSAENDFVATVTQGNVRNWLGAYQPDGVTWTWLTGESFAYTNWAPGEPNNLGGIEDYLQLYGTAGPSPGQWNDAWYYSPTPGYVVEYGSAAPATPPLPTTAPPIEHLPPVNAFYDGLQTTLSQYADEFDSDSYNFLMTNANSTALLIDPTSPSYLKDFASNLGDSLREVGGLYDVVASVTSGTAPEELAFDLAKDTIISDAIANLPPDDQDPVDAIWSAVDLINATVADGFKIDNPVSFAFGVNGYFLEHLLAPAADIFASDPPDDDFTEIYTPHITYSSALPSTGTPDWDTLLQQQDYAFEQATAYLQSVNASFDKYAGAIGAGDNIHATLQMEALLQYLSLYNQSAQNAIDMTQESQEMLNSMGIGGAKYKPGKLRSFQSQIARRGLPAPLVTVLNGLA